MNPSTEEKRDQANATALPEDVVEALMRQIERYLEVVEFFRAQGCEPAWS
jgi:hypothetical protein